MSIAFNPTELILHCSDTEDGPNLSWPAIKRFHKEVNGWTDIGYHFGIERYGDGYVLLPGRDPRLPGAHCRAARKNYTSLGLCVVGKYDLDSPSEELYTMVAKGAAWICMAHGIDPSAIAGHCEYEPAKTCPGRRFNVREVQERVMDYLNTASDIGRHIVLNGG